MRSIVDLGCDIAEVHHQYAAIHSALFGASSFRLVIAAMTGRTSRSYREYLQNLDHLQIRLSELAAEITTVDAAASALQAEQLRAVLSEYVASLNAAIVSLHGMCEQLLRDEDGYREIPPGKQSAFNRDKTAYDGVLLQLDQLGRSLNKLFSRY